VSTARAQVRRRSLEESRIPDYDDSMHYEVIIDAGETINKCTIAPLSSRPDFRLFRVKGPKPLGPLLSPILLHHEGQCLTQLREQLPQVQGIATIDCVWNRLDVLMRRISGQLPILARIPNGFETAYPRRSAQNTDPEGGLATIEAIFVAAALLGNWDITLFSEYYFGGKFVDLNRELFLKLGVSQAGDPQCQPVLPARIRTSQQRRRDRGRF
jgi:pre-rRNA-processing protein TSR3